MTHVNRRKFIKSTAAISAVTIVSPSIAFGSKANSAIRMGIIGGSVASTEVKLVTGTVTVGSWVEYDNLSTLVRALSCDYGTHSPICIQLHVHNGTVH